MNEGESVEVCAIITATDSTVTAALSVVDGSAIGRNSSDTVHTITLENALHYIHVQMYYSKKNL